MDDRFKSPMPNVTDINGALKIDTTLFSIRRHERTHIKDESQKTLQHVMRYLLHPHEIH